MIKEKTKTNKKQNKTKQNKQKQTNKTKQSKTNKTKQTKNNNKSKPTPQTITQNKVTNFEMKVSGATLHK